MWGFKTFGNCFGMTGLTLRRAHQLAIVFVDAALG